MGGCGIKLRPYQEHALTDLYGYFEHENGSPLIVMPTASGKSVVIAEFCRRAITDWPETRIIVATHVRELIEQNHSKMLAIWPDAPAGIYSAGLKRKEMDKTITFAGIQSIYKQGLQFPAIDLLLVDEAHTISRLGLGMWNRFIKDLKIINPLMKVIGFTATPFRLDSGMLHHGEDRLFTHIAHEADMIELIKDGYLCELVNEPTETILDVTGVHKRGGEFIEKELQAKVDLAPLTAECVREIIRKGAERGSWLIFCSGVQHAQHVAQAIKDHGIECECITGETPSGERNEIIARFRSGKLRAITNANVLLTGFDAPGADLLACLRPTGSPGLYVQMMGRGMRIAPGKDNCLVLDFADNVGRFGPVDKVRWFGEKPSGEGEAPIKTCPKCEAMVHAARLICPDCGYNFPPPDKDDKLIPRASKAALLSTQMAKTGIPVDDVQYFRHQKEGKPDSMRVEYRCGLQTYKEWVCFEHHGFPRENAAMWWRQHAPGYLVPNTVGDALERIALLRKPATIYIKPIGKYTEIAHVSFDATQQTPDHQIPGAGVGSG